MEALPERSNIADAWERGDELISIILRLPSDLVLKSGLSAQRLALIDRYDSLEPPPLEGDCDPEEVKALGRWIHDAETIIAYIVKIGQGDVLKKTSPKITYSAKITDPDDLPKVLDSMSDSDFVSDNWSWPWNYRKSSIAVKEKAKWYSGNAVKFGVLAGVVGMIAIVAVDEDD